MSTSFPTLSAPRFFSWWDSRGVRKFLRNPKGVAGLIIVVIYFLMAAFAPLLAPFDPDAVDLFNVSAPPDSMHWFGVDQFGRDILSRTIYGARTSLALGSLVVVVASVIGVIFGSLAGYFEKTVDRIVVFLCDVLMTLPSIVTALAVVTILGPGLTSTIIAIAFASIPRLVRISRSAVIQVRGLEYIQSARALGAHDLSIIIDHVIPNSLSPVIVQASLLMAEAVLVAAGLGFLGLGVQPPTAEWGQMLAEGRAYMRSAPFITVFPGVAIIILVLGLNLLGDGLRDALDVRAK